MATWRPTRRSKNLKLGMRRGSGMLCGGKYCCVVGPHLQKGALITTCDETQEQRRTSVENNSVGNLCELELQRQKKSHPHLRAHRKTHIHVQTRRPVVHPAATPLKEVHPCRPAEAGSNNNMKSAKELPLIHVCRTDDN